MTTSVSSEVQKIIGWTNRQSENREDVQLPDGRTDKLNYRVDYLLYKDITKKHKTLFFQIKL